MNLRCEVCHKLVNTLIRSQCFTCYERTRRRARAAKTRGARFKIRLYYCLDGRRKFNETSEPNFRC